MNNPKTETLSLRVPNELKTEWEEAFELSGETSKTDFFQKLLNGYHNPQKKELSDETQESLAANIDDSETVDQEQAEKSTVGSATDKKVVDAPDQEPEPDSNDDPQITIKLNLVQFFAMKETILGPDFVDETNQEIEKIDNSIDNSLFGNKLLSGLYAGVFKKMNPDTEDDLAIKENIGAMLVNLFMANIISGPGDYIETPVTRRVLESYIKELADSQEEAK